MFDRINLPIYLGEHNSQRCSSLTRAKDGAKVGTFSSDIVQVSCTLFVAKLFHHCPSSGYS